MTGRPYDWNAVVAGAWNLAILTPQGVTTRLFGLPPGAPVEVQVPLDMLGPARVIHEGVMVVPSTRRVLVQPIRCTGSDLARAAQIASRGIDSLPATPFFAAGINIRFVFEALPDSLLEYATSTLDDRLSDAGHAPQSWFLKRAISWRGGVLNFELLREPSAGGTVLFNLHKDSTSPNELMAWLGRALELANSVRELATDTLALRLNWEGME